MSILDKQLGEKKKEGDGLFNDTFKTSSLSISNKPHVSQELTPLRYLVYLDTALDSVRSWCDGSSDRSLMVDPLGYLVSLDMAIVSVRSWGDGSSDRSLIVDSLSYLVSLDTVL